MKTVLGVLFAGVILVGCGDSHPVDVEAWQADLESQGVHVADWPKYEAVYTDLW